MIRKQYTTVLLLVIAIVYSLIAAQLYPGGSPFWFFFILLTPYLFVLLSIIFHSWSNERVQTLFKSCLVGFGIFAIYHLVFRLTAQELNAYIKGSHVGYNLYIGFFVTYIIALPIVVLIVYVSRALAKKSYNKRLQVDAAKPRA